MNTLCLAPKRTGSAIVTALICAAIIGVACAATLSIVQARYLASHQAAAWKESLLASEAGVELAMNEVRKSLFDPPHAWEDWTEDAHPALFPIPNAPEGTSASFVRSITSRPLLREGESSLRSWASVTVDAPYGLRDRTGEQWFRIRSLGMTELPGRGLLAGRAEDVTLRKFDIKFDRRTGKPIDHPRAARLIEVVVKPVGAFRLAMLGIESVDMTDQNILIDSYDSRDDSASTNGRYDPAKRQANADVATNGQLINAGSAQVYGDVLTNGGTVLDTDNVHGEIRDDFYQEVFTVTHPTVTPEPDSPLYVRGEATLAAHAGSPANYVLSGISLAGDEVLRVEGSPDGAPRYAQIIVTGNISLTGMSQIVLDPGVFVRIFVEGDADVGGQGFLNPGTPLNLQIYGVDRPKNADGTPATIGNIKIAGSSDFCGAIYAPNYDVTLVGGGNTGASYGAFVGNTLRMTGVQRVHYDEALADGGLISDYKIVSWFEDEH